MTLADIAIFAACITVGTLTWYATDNRLGRLTITGKPGHTSRAPEWRDILAIIAMWIILLALLPTLPHRPPPTPSSNCLGNCWQITPYLEPPA